MPVILTTGSIRPEDVAAAEQLGVCSVIAKPNTVQALAEALHEALEGKRGNDLWNSTAPNRTLAVPRRLLDFAWNLGENLRQPPVRRYAVAIAINGSAVPPHNSV